MLKIGLDIGTGFVKCVSDLGRIMFPSLYVRRNPDIWTKSVSEAVGDGAMRMLGTAGTTAVRPIVRGRPDPRYQRQIEMLIKESVSRIRTAAGRGADSGGKARIVVGLPYGASEHRDGIAKMVRRSVDIDRCDVVAQAVGTLVDLGRSSGMVVSVGQGTTEIVVIDGNEVIDGESVEWASDYITRKIGRFAYLRKETLLARAATCKKYSRVLAENLAGEISDMAAGYSNQYGIILSGGGILIPGVREELESRLEGFTISVPEDPVMSNASGLYKLVE